MECNSHTSTCLHAGFILHWDFTTILVWLHWTAGQQSEAHQQNLNSHHMLQSPFGRKQTVEGGSPEIWPHAASREPGTLLLQEKSDQGYNTQESHYWKQQLATVVISTPCVSPKLHIAPGSSVNPLPFLNLNICLLFSSRYLSDCSCQDNHFINTSTSAHLSWASLPFTITSRQSVARNGDFWNLAFVFL